MKWIDIGSHRSNISRPGTDNPAWRGIADNMTFQVSRRAAGKRAWYLFSAAVEIEGLELKSKDIADAKEEAKQILRVKLRAVLASLDFEE
jgi:hypothetical protein